MALTATHQVIVHGVPDAYTSPQTNLRGDRICDEASQMAISSLTLPSRGTGISSRQEPTPSHAR